MLRSKRLWILVSALIAVSVLGFGWNHVQAQVENSRYFPETGHWVTDEFLLKYESIPNPTLLYGAPITEAFEDTFGTKVQYFEKVRFERDPTLPSSIQVKLSPLGEYLYQEGKKLGLSTNSPACRPFPETGHSVCYAFLDFFDKNGGISQFGYPISGFEDHDGRFVQFFQNARLEWHPENAPGKWVTVSNLGLRYFYHHEEDLKLLNPVLEGDNIPNVSVLRLRTKAFVSSSVLPSNEKQTIFVIVQDQNFKPVPGVKVEFKVTLPDGSTKEYRTSNTNAAGISMLNFSVGTGSKGVANIEVFTDYGNLEGQTRTSFNIWW
jgi:hypothetical protein